MYVCFRPPFVIVLVVVVVAAVAEEATATEDIGCEGCIVYGEVAPMVESALYRASHGSSM